VHKKQQKQEENLNWTNNKQWAKFTYTGRDTRIITKLSKHTNIQIAFMTQNNLKILLRSDRGDRHSDVYNQSGVYQLTCNTCQKRYTGQTGFSFRTQFKEHEQDHRYNGGKSLYTKHLLDHNHLSQSTDNSLHILCTAQKGRLLNVIRNFYSHRETVVNNQLNEKMTTKSNIILVMIIRHTQPPLTSYRMQHNRTLIGIRATPTTTMHIRHQPPPHHSTWDAGQKML
jgi:hypothetical protein